MVEIYTNYYESPLGWCEISFNDEVLFSMRIRKGLSLARSRMENERRQKVLYRNALFTQAEKELSEYFAGKRQNFDLPLLLEGTDFQKKVWQALLEIPYGETRSYKDIAQAIGNEKACRAVGSANNKNPLFIIVPCHRVVGADKKLVGYGAGIDVKEYLLRLEGVHL